MITIIQHPKQIHTLSEHLKSLLKKHSKTPSVVTLSIKKKSSHTLKKNSKHTRLYECIKWAEHKQNPNMIPAYCLYSPNTPGMFSHYKINFLEVFQFEVNNKLRPLIYTLTQAHKLVTLFFRKKVILQWKKVPGVLGEQEQYAGIMFGCECQWMRVHLHTYTNKGSILCCVCQRTCT